MTPLAQLEPILDGCGCCEGITILTPATLENRPGLDAIVFRVGTHGSFKTTMKALIALQPALRRLTTRDDDDPSIALFDGWATVLDVLSFYQERIANEGYLRTAVERRSILELARSIGYELAPGVAASTYIAFTLESAVGSPGFASIPIGTKVQSLPNPEEKPQTFETVEPLEARAEWNLLRPATTEPQLIVSSQKSLWLKGSSTGLQPGDVLAIIGDERTNSAGSDNWDARILLTVEPDNAANVTKVTWEQGLGKTNPTVLSAQQNPRAYAFRQRASLFGYNAPDARNLTGDLYTNYRTKIERVNNKRQWKTFQLTDNRIDLDTTYPKIVEDSWLVLQASSTLMLYNAFDVTAASREDFTLTAKITRVIADTNESFSSFGLRSTVVHAVSEEIPLAERRLTFALQPDVLPPVAGNEIRLDSFVPGLVKGMRVIVSGKPMRAMTVGAKGAVFTVTAADGLTTTVSTGESWQLLEAPALLPSGYHEWHLLTKDGFDGYLVAGWESIKLLPALDDDDVRSELGTIDEAVAVGSATTTITLEDALVGYYDRSTVAIYANVAHATHGETRNEVLGSGDASVPFQQFELKGKPLTYVSATSPTGSETTLRVRVDNILWEEVESLYGRGPRERIYVTHRSDDGTVTVQFGDGITGARVPSGNENVKATYRVGTGLDGLLDEGQLSLLMTRPLGVKGIATSLAPTGAADPQLLEDARGNAPLTVLTLERIVSLRDFEDFARAFAGIGKAQATWLWNGGTRLVHITAAAADGSEIDTTSSLYTNLKDAIRLAGDPLHIFRVDSFDAITFNVSARILYDPAYDKEMVADQIEQTLIDTFSFERRAFAQGVSRGEVIALIQGVPGVTAVDLELLYRTGSPATLETFLQSKRARWEGGKIRPAQLLTIFKYGITLTEMIA